MYFTIITVSISLTVCGFLLLMSSLHTTSLKKWASRIPAATILQGSPQVDSGRTMLLFTEGKDLYGAVSVGTPKDGVHQELRVLFDTSSNHMWIVSTDTGNKFPGVNTMFDKKKSTSFKTENKAFEQKFDGGKITGYRVKDKVMLRTEPGRLVIDEQEFGMVTSITSKSGELFKNYGVIIGLNLISNELIPGEPQPLINSLVPTSEKMPFGSFGLYINKMIGEPSLLVFGDKDKDLIESAFTYHPVVTIGGVYNGWNVQIDKFQIFHPTITNWIGVYKKTEIKTNKGTYAQIVTRSNAFLEGPKDIINQLTEIIFSYATFRYDKKNNYRFDCDVEAMKNAFKALPHLRVIINGKILEFSAASYILETSDDVCELNIYGNDNLNFTIGRSFMTKYYTKFDYANKMVQFAMAKKVDL